MDEKTKDLIYEMFMAMKKDLKRVMEDNLNNEFYTLYDAFVATDDAETRNSVMRAVIQLSVEYESTHNRYMNHVLKLMYGN